MATPNFQTPQTNPFGLTVVGDSSSPSFADIDGDGDLDALVGIRDGNTYFYLNSGTASNPIFQAPQTNPFGLTDVGSNSSPSFADIDGDGDLDAFVGESKGNTRFYLNSGTASAPSFQAPQTNAFGLTDVGSFSSPSFADIDGDGDLDTFVGAFDGNTRFYLNAPANAAPTGIIFSNTTTSIAENSSTTTRLKVADITITDDGQGTNTLSLSGTDAALFEIDTTTNTLYLKANIVLDYETKSSYSVSVNVDDAAIGSTPDATQAFTLIVTDVSEPPTGNTAPTGIIFSNTTTSIAENSSTTTRLKVADITVTDDGQGTNILSLSGTDAALFEIDSVTQSLYLKANTVLDYETKSSYSVSVEVDDAAIGSTPDATQAFTLTVTDVSEPPTGNTAPTISGTAPTSVDEDTLYSFTPNALDADNDTLTYLIVNKPTWATFDPNTGRLSGTPTNSNVGTASNIGISVSDPSGAKADLPTFNLTIRNVNDTPTVKTAIVDQSATAGTAFSFTLPSQTFQDVDLQDSLTLKAALADGSSLPSWLSFNAATGKFSGTPPQAGSIALKVTATDTANAAISDEFSVAIAAASTPGTTPDLLGGQPSLLPTTAFGRTTNRINGTPKVDRLTGGKTNDLINGLSRNDRLNGGAGDDILRGGKGNDRLNGGVGNDRLNGSQGNDRLIGGRGDDRLVGGLGKDTLTGGAGRDVFVFKNTAANSDAIVDFDRSSDLIDLRGIFTKPRFADVAIAQVMRLAQVGANTEIKIDTDGLGSGTSFATIASLQNVSATSLTASQFVIR